ncbi:MAG: hypothetical protein ACYCYA_09360 [Actinomycetes bacterium]
MNATPFGSSCAAATRVRASATVSGSISGASYRGVYARATGFRGIRRRRTASLSALFSVRRT